MAYESMRRAASTACGTRRWHESRHTSRASRRRRGGRKPSTRPIGRESALGFERPARPRRRLARLESAAEPTVKSTADPKLTATPSTRNGESGRGGHADSEAEAAGREQTPNTGKTTGKTTKKNHTGPRHPRPPEAAEAHVDVLRVLPRDVGRAAVHGRRRAGLRYSGGQLDRAVRPAR